MFTGIIQHVGVVRAARAVGSGRRLAIDVGPLAARLKPGDSLCVSGACLTACRIEGALAEFDLAAETVSRTTLGDARSGTKVNLEAALRVGDGLDGHLVQGHVDAVGQVARVDRGAEQWAVEFAAPDHLTDEMVPKGSVAVHGVSLTLTHVGKGAFGVVLIPTTWKNTTFADLRPGEAVNVETDVIGKYVRRYLRQMSGRDSAANPPPPAGGLTLDKLRDAGYV